LRANSYPAADHSDNPDRAQPATIRLYLAGKTGYVRRLSSAEVLYWDDFGRTHLSGAASEMLLHVVEQRVSHERALLLTSQYGGSALELQFQRPEMGAAVRRRINEFCRVIEACENLLKIARSVSKGSAVNHLTWLLVTGHQTYFHRFAAI
jgi:hypothetical protein